MNKSVNRKWLGIVLAACALALAGWAFLGPTNAESEFRDRVLAAKDEPHRTIYKGLVFDVTDIVEEFFADDPSRVEEGLVDVLGFNGGDRPIKDPNALREYNADYYRLFKKHVAFVRWYSTWECEVYLFYQDDKRVELRALVKYRSP